MAWDDWKAGCKEQIIQTSPKEKQTETWKAKCLKLRQSSTTHWSQSQMEAFSTQIAPQSKVTNLAAIEDNDDPKKDPVVS